MITMPLAIANRPAVRWSTVTRASCARVTNGSTDFHVRGQS